MAQSAEGFASFGPADMARGDEAQSPPPPRAISPLFDLFKKHMADKIHCDS